MASHTKASKRKSWFRFFAYILFLFFAFIVGGFLIFAHNVETQAQPNPIPKADGIVVWTGKGGDRLSAGVKLLSDGFGERLLISGVNEQNSREDVVSLLNISETHAECCLDLDYEAVDTIGNARETANWAEALGYEHVILVTSAYHMPRAQIEIAASNSGIQISPFPVKASASGSWWRDGDRFQQISKEYGKLLVTYARRAGNRGAEAES